MKRIFHTYKKHLKLWLPVAILAVIVAGEFFFLRSVPHGPASDASLAAYAKQVVQKCSSASYRPTCYETEIPQLMQKISMEDAFKVTALVQDDDTSYKYCHVLGHKLAAAEVDKDPSLWQQVIQRCPSGLCSNGCIHGAFQERFRKESLTPAEIQQFKPQLEDVCEEKPGFDPTGMEQASCYHALGHLTMYITSADIPASLQLCDELALKGTRDYRHLCYDGVFMQIYQPLEPDDFSLIAGQEVSKDQAVPFCNKFSGAEQGSCWSEAWPLFNSEIQQPGGALDFCSYLKDPAENARCFDAVMYIVTAQKNLSVPDMVNYCSAMPTGDRANCFAQAASRLVETDYREAPDAMSLCAASDKTDSTHLCYDELLGYSTYNFHVGTPAFNQFCSDFPAQYQPQCLAGNSRMPIQQKPVAE